MQGSEKEGYSDRDTAAYAAYQKDFASDVSTGKYGKDRPSLSQDQAHKIGYSSPSASKLALNSASRAGGRGKGDKNIDPTTGRKVNRVATTSDVKRIGLDKKGYGAGSAANTPITKKKSVAKKKVMKKKKK